MIPGLRKPSDAVRLRESGVSEKQSGGPVGTARLGAAIYNIASTSNASLPIDSTLDKQWEDVGE